jgi:hypothetical protein
VTIDILPDYVLLEIFNHYVGEAEEVREVEAWQTLVHVCQNWRSLVFGSPSRLNLRLRCSARTPVREKLVLWPPLPIIIRATFFHETCSNDNIIAALEHKVRIREITLLNVHIPLLETVATAMQGTFPALIFLQLETLNVEDTTPVLPDSFLGGSAPHLRRLWLGGISFPFPGLRRLPLSAPNLVFLSLRRIPHSGYLSLEAMVTCLSALTRLQRLDIGFKSPRSRPPRGVRYPARSVLPALVQLRFIGASEYLEDLVARIDAPLLNHLHIKFFHQLIFDTPQLAQFIGRTPNFEAPDEARVIFSDSHVAVLLPWFDSSISCRQSDWQLSSLVQVCTSAFPRALISTVEHLYILEDRWSRPRWQADVENSQWLEFMHLLTAVKHLYLSRNFVSRIAPTLQELVGQRVSEVLPALQSIFLEDLQQSGPVPEAIGQFVAARQLSSRPIAVSNWTM